MSRSVLIFLVFFSFCESYILSLACFMTLHKCKFFFCRARAVARVIGSSREWVVEVELVVPGRPLGLFPASNNGPHRQATVLPWMAQRPAMGRIQARRVGGPAIVAPPDSVGGLSVIRGGIVEQPLSVAADGPEMGILEKSGQWWELAGLELHSICEVRPIFSVERICFKWKLLHFGYFNECLMSMPFPKKWKFGLL